MHSNIEGAFMQRFTYGTDGMEAYKASDRSELERNNVRPPVPYSIQKQGEMIYLKSETKPLIEICSITKKYMFWRLERDGETDRFYVLIRRS